MGAVRRATAPARAVPGEPMRDDPSGAGSRPPCRKLFFHARAVIAIWNA